MPRQTRKPLTIVSCKPLTSPVETYALHKPTCLMQDAVLDFFESLGLPTYRKDPRAMEGYHHSLGHGVGIDIHERPSLSHIQRDDIFQVGNVFSIEPGLYFPERGHGVRVEDLCLIDENGELVSLSPFRKDLVIPLKSGIVSLDSEPVRLAFRFAVARLLPRLSRRLYSVYPCARSHIPMSSPADAVNCYSVSDDVDIFSQRTLSTR